MNNIDVILKAITLLNRERELDGELADNSTDLARTVLETIQGETRGKFYNGGDSDVLENLKHLLKDMINNPDNYSKESLLQSLELIVKDRPNLFKIIDKYINVELSVPSLKRTIISLRSTLNNYYKENQIRSLITSASYKITTNNIGSESILEFASKLSNNIDALSVKVTTKDPGIIDELDIGDEDNMSVMVNRVRDQSVDGGKLKTGWKDQNIMLQGKCA